MHGATSPHSTGQAALTCVGRLWDVVGARAMPLQGSVTRHKGRRTAAVIIAFDLARACGDDSAPAAVIVAHEIALPRDTWNRLAAVIVGAQRPGTA
jgi:hypothetical protein